MSFDEILDLPVELSFFLPFVKRLCGLRPLLCCGCALLLQFQGGIIVSVDSRSTMGPYIGELQALQSTVVPPRAVLVVLVAQP